MTSRYRFLCGPLLLFISGLVISACGTRHSSASSPTQPPATQTSALPVPDFTHIFVIVLENKGFDRITGENQAPYLRALAHQYGRANQFYGIAHPSLPNYLAVLGGDTFGITTNCTDCLIDKPNLVDQLETAGKSWKGYMESMPSPCFIGDAAPLYRQKHNPFIYFNDIRTNPSRCKKIVPFTEFASDLQANALPQFVWITPNMCNNMHDCPVRAGDDWLKSWVPQILASPAWQDHGLLVITFDEGELDDASGCCGNATGGRIATLVISPLSRPGFTSDIAYTHYSLLRTIEAAWKLPLLGHANCDCAMPMADFFIQPHR